MACFLVCAAEAVVATAAEKAAQEKESVTKAANEVGVRITFSQKLKWLRNMLVGGAALLAFEHVWHGEVVPWFPFLTAMNDPGDTAEMLHEMSTIGVTMCLIVTAVWAAMVLVTNAMEKKVLQSHAAVQ
jgi:hypothetical protein